VCTVYTVCTWLAQPGVTELGAYGAPGMDSRGPERASQHVLVSNCGGFWPKADDPQQRVSHWASINTMF
jgi:hypothetical protein